MKDYDIVLKRRGECVGRYEIRGNHQRLSVTDVDPVECDEVEFIFLSTNGADKVTVFEVRAY